MLEILGKGRRLLRSLRLSASARRTARQVFAAISGLPARRPAIFVVE
jgi:hypothetical protein